MINNGDVLITKLERGFFGAFRILKAKGKFDFSDYEFFLIVITSYISKTKPIITDKHLTETLCEKRFFYNDRPNINIYSGRFIEKYFEYLGNIPLTREEEKLKIKIGDGTDGGFPLAGAIQKNFGFNAFLEWRWENEKEECLKEQEAAEERAKEFQMKRVMKPKKMILDELFWKIIDMFDWTKENDDMIVAVATKYLSKLKVTEIKQFEENLTYKLYCLDTKEHAKHIGGGSYNEKDDYVSVDFFLYARCSAVAKGKAFYNLVLNDPTLMPKDSDFEILLSLSSTAYELKTKREFDYITGCDYETYSNEDGWNIKRP